MTQQEELQEALQTVREHIKHLETELEDRDRRLDNIRREIEG